RLRREDLHASRRELNREWKAVQPVDDLGDGCGVLRSDAEDGPHRHRALHEEPDGVGLREYLERWEAFGVWEIQRRHRKLLLAGDAKRRPARCDDLQHRTRAEKLTHDGRGAEDLLEVVKHEEHLFAANVIDYARKWSLGARDLNTERVRDGRWHELGVGYRRKRDEERAIAESIRRLLGDAQRESGLSRPSGPGERDEARLPEASLRFGDLALAAG